MRTLKHTPSPWVYEYDRFLDKFLIISGSANILASINNNSHEIPVFEQEANAKLMAAAPDMLESMIYAVECLEMFDNLGDAGDQALQALKKSIKKATE